MLFMLVLMAALLPTSVALADSAVLYEKDTPYHHLKVVQQGDMRTLFLGAIEQSAIKLSDPLHIDYEYVKGMVSALGFSHAQRDVLIMGLGGGTLASYLQTCLPQMELEVAEIDPDVAQVAQRYFGFSPGLHTRLFVRDGRMHLRSSSKKYDVIFLDAYASDTIPFHLTTREFLLMVREHLKPGGVVISNVWVQDVNRYYLSHLRTYQEVFDELHLLKMGQSGSVIFIGTAQKTGLDKRALMERASALVGKYALNVDAPGIIEQGYSNATTMKIDAPVLTDDYAPVDLLRTMKAQ